MSTRPSAPKGPKPPTSLHPSCIIAENAILTGTHPITLSANVIIHPRARLNSTCGPITLGSGCIIEEKASIGLLSSANPVDTRSTPQPGEVRYMEHDGSNEEDEGDRGEVEGVVLENGVFVEVGAVVEARRVGEGSVVEVKARVGRGCVVGKHCKISPLCHIDENDILQDGTVVYGTGQRRIESGLGGVWEKRMEVRRLRAEVERGLVKGDLERWRS
ncbi:MAG: hypothetical protein M1836_002535 [Candelina mexicana]|nr:MAG: hypothetical protein M1836_002535 [Candelina mexicana]